MMLIINTYSILAKLTTVFTVFLDKYLDVSSSHEKSEAGRIGAFYFDPGEKGSFNINLREQEWGHSTLIRLKAIHSSEKRAF